MLLFTQNLEIIMETDKSNSGVDNELSQALVNLYLNVKVRTMKNVKSYNDESQNKERESLRDANPLILIEYIKSSIEILGNLKAEGGSCNKSLSESAVSETQENYEDQIQKLEAETRMHIRVYNLS